MSKSTTTVKRPPAKSSDASQQEQWGELRLALPIYLALAKRTETPVPFPHDKRALAEKPSPELVHQVETWLDAMDKKVMVHQLRALLQTTTLSASESDLRALIQRHLCKTQKTNTDRDKIDFLLVQYFALCAPANVYHKQITLADVAQVMKPVLGEADPARLEWCEPLEKMIEALRGFRSLRDLLKTNFIEQGRKVKEGAGGMFYDTTALVSFIRFNFLLRRTVIELMHADLIAIRSGITLLESAGVRLFDCRNCGLSDAEPVAKMRLIADEWKQPFQKEYTERTVNQAFEQLLGLRADVERAVEKVSGKPQEGPAARSVGIAPKPAPIKNLEKKENKAVAPAKPRAAKEKPAPNTPPPGDPEAVLDLESCMEKIWEQLIAAPPDRGRSMTTVRVGGARLLMSSWEVIAFISEDGPAAEDLRRAVVARALVTAALESAKETGNATSLERALSVARVEVSRLQERVDVAKQAKDTEAAVNLGITRKRLISALDEAEKLK